jgi:D-alanyl-D-alanine carboxypeptidase
MKRTPPLRIALVTLVAVVAVTAVPAAAAPDREAKLQRALDELVAAGSPGAIVLVRDGDRTLRLAGGDAILEPGRRMRPTDRFRIASVTKTFTATVVLQLVGEGKLSLDDTVEHWLPGLVPDGEGITVRQLLNMSSGLYDYLVDEDTTVRDRIESGDVEYRWAPRELVAIATAHEPKFAPGAGYSYCNTCYVLLGLIVEEATGSSIGAELRRRIFTPLRLRATTFDTEPRIAGRHAHGYLLLGEPPLIDVSVLSPSWGWAAGAIVSTADDLARFYRALLDGRVLRPDLLQAMRTTSVGVSSTDRYGLGLAQVRMPCGTAWGHQGGIAGYETYVLASRNGRHESVVFTNLDGSSASKRAEQALQRLVVAAYCER